MMNTVKFAKKIEAQRYLLDEIKEKIVKKSIAWDGPTLKQIVAIEELSELQKEITKMLRGEGEYMNFLEELADVYICLDFLKRINDVDEDMLDRAICVKLDRDRERVEDEIKHIKENTRSYFGW